MGKRKRRRHPLPIALHGTTLLMFISRHGLLLVGPSLRCKFTNLTRCVFLTVLIDIN